MSNLFLRLKFKPLFDTTINKNIKLRCRWIDNHNYVEFIPIDTYNKWITISLKCNTDQFALAISCFVDNYITDSISSIKFPSQQCVGSLLIPNIIHIPTKETNLLSIGIDIGIPTFEIYIDPIQSYLVRKDHNITLQTIKEYKDETVIENKLLPLKEEIKADIVNIYNKLLSSDSNNRWMRRALRMVNMVFDPRECNLWSGNMIPALFSDLLVKYDKKSNINPYIHFYLFHYYLTLQEMGLLSSTTPFSKVEIAEIFIRTMARTARLYLYGNDLIMKDKSTTTTSLQPDYENENKTNSWRLKYQILRTKTNNYNNNKNNNSDISQEGDQLSIPRLSANPALARVDCEDVALEICINFYHFQQMLEINQHLTSIPSSIYSVFKSFNQYTLMMCDCTMINSKTRTKIENGSLKYKDIITYDKYYYEEIKTKNSNIKLNPDDASFDMDSSYFEEHVTCIGISTDLFQLLVQKGNDDSHDIKKILVVDMPTIILEGTDTYFGCQLDPSFYEKEFKNGNIQEPYKLNVFHELFINTYSLSFVWSFLQPRHTINQCKRYGFASCVYSHEAGQRWFYNKTTKCFDIPFHILLNHKELLKDEWCLISLSDNQKLERKRYQSIIQQEMLIPCYQLPSSSSSSQIKDKDNNNNINNQPIALYCRKVDWDLSKEQFLKWIKQHINILQLVNDDPELLQLNEFQQVYRVWIHML